MAQSLLRPADEVLAEQLKNPEVREIWERTAPARAVALRVVAYRAEHSLSQSQLGRILGMSQPAVARLETGEHSPTIETLVRLAEALDIEILVDIKPNPRRASWLTPTAEQASVIEKVTTSKGGEIVVLAS